MHVDVGKFSVIGFIETMTSLDRSQDWPLSFTFRPTPLIVSGLPHYRDADEVHPAAMATDAAGTCRLGQPRAAGSDRVTAPVNRGRQLTRDSVSSLSRPREPGTNPTGRVRAGGLG